MEGPLGSVERFVSLVQSPPERMETVLRELLGPRLVPLGSGPGEPRIYRFADAADRRVDLSFDRSRVGVRLAGTTLLVGQFVRLIRDLDGGSQADGRVVQVVPVHHADPAKVQQAVEAYRTGAGGGNPLPLVRSGSEGQAPQSPGRRTSGPHDEDQSRYFPHTRIEQVSYLFQPGPASAAGAAAGAAPPAMGTAPAAAAPGAAVPKGPKPPLPSQPAEPQDRRERLRQLDPDVEIETLPDLGVIILRGRDRDVQELKRLIEEIERLSVETQPVIEIYPLKHVEGEALSLIANQVLTELIAGRQGRVSITPLVKPNAYC